MANKIYDLVIKTGSYTNQQGEEKGRYKNIGCCMQGQDGGMFLLLDKTFNPAGVPSDGDACLISMFAPKPREQAPQPQPQYQAAPQPAPQYQPLQSQPQYNAAPQGQPLPPDLTGEPF